ncbi:TIR domain-containing adapter molecule 1 [Macrotis lagotis]|uniref:TIR domain-containing adapter molecule 1 n=1 Tax=Macrotis lagotis TaxID=92651 RepID=UPI003D685E05
MAEHTPSLKEAFDILHHAGQDKLLYLKHKLKLLRPGSKANSLLQAMVLLSLGQETEAKIVLDSLRGDKVALSVARTWEGTEPLLNQADLLPSEEQADLLMAIARIYHLFEEEKLCDASSQTQAYQAAVQALSLRHDARLDDFLAEAQSHCGDDILGAESFQILKSDTGYLPLSFNLGSRINSQPWPIKTKSSILATESLPQSLRSTGTPASFTSNLEISQSPTLPFLTQQSQKRCPRGLSKLCEDCQTNSTQDREPQEPEEMSWPFSDPATSLPVQLNNLASVAPETSIHSSVECLNSTTPQSNSMKSEETVSKGDLGELPGLPPTSVPPAREEKDTPFSMQKGHFPKDSGSRPSFSTQDPSLPLPPPLSLGSELDTGQRFFNFVILHAEKDEAIALRVKDTLESLGVPNGTTFCEEFQVPGCFELRCLQDAIDNSAFIVLLLTRHYKCSKSFHQVHTALMNSITKSEKKNSVIPFFPQESTLKPGDSEISQLLINVVSLDEKSPIFFKKVKNTFTPRKLQDQREKWKKQQEIRAIQEQTKRMVVDRERVSQKEIALSDLAYQQSLLHQQLQNLALAFPSQVSSALGHSMPLPPSPWAYNFPTQPTAASPVFQPNNGLFSPPMPFPPDPSSSPELDAQSARAQPLIIHNAQMVQLGYNNYMWGRKEGQVLNEEEATEGE